MATAVDVAGLTDWSVKMQGSVEPAEVEEEMALTQSRTGC